MAWIKQVSVLVAFVWRQMLPRLKRRGPTVLFLSFCLSQWSRWNRPPRDWLCRRPRQRFLRRRMLFRRLHKWSVAPDRPEDLTLPEVVPVPPAFNVPTLPARDSPGVESQTMSLANSALIPSCGRNGWVLLLAVLVLSKLPRKVRQRASAGPSGVVEIVARWPVAKGERLILVV